MKSFVASYQLLLWAALVGKIQGNEDRSSSSSSSSLPDLVQRRLQTTTGPMHRRAQNTVKTFCNNLDDIEEYVLGGFEAMFAPNLPTYVSDGVQCSCTSQKQPSLAIECAVRFKYESNSTTVHRISEVATFTEQDGGGYDVKKTGWCDENEETGEKYCEDSEFCDGHPCNCTAGPGCTCNICPDMSGMEVDCSKLDDSLKYHTWSASCENQYTGAFLNSYSFKRLPRPPEPAATTKPIETVTADELCSDPEDLEAYLLQEYQHYYIRERRAFVLSDGFDCTCPTNDRSTLDIECKLRFRYNEGEEARILFESVSFKLDSGRYKITKTGWCEYKEGLNEKERFCEESIYCDDGATLCSCSAPSGCASCDVCPGTEFLSLNCLERNVAAEGEAFNNFANECIDQFTSSYFNDYPFDNLVKSNARDVGLWVSAAVAPALLFSSFLYP